MTPSAANHVTDRELIAHCLANDKEAWKELFTTHDAALFCGVRQALGKAGRDANEVEDRVQDVRLLLFADPRVLRAYNAARGSLADYLAGVAKRNARE